MKKILSIILLSTSSIFCANVLANTEHDNTKELEESLVSAMLNNISYSGKYSNIYDAGYGLGCKKDRRFLIDWKSEIEDLTVKLEPNGVAKFYFTLDKSRAYISYTGTTSLCLFQGYFGDVLTDKIRGSFHLTPQPGDEPALIEMKSLSLSNLEFKDWTLFRPFIIDYRGDAPDFLNSWSNKNLNKVFAWFLKSSFSDKFNKFVSKKVDDELKRRYEDHKDLNRLIDPNVRSETILHLN